MTVPETEMSFQAQLGGLKARIEPMARLVSTIIESVAKPLFYHSGEEHYGFRFGNPGALHFCLLKAVRAVSSLNAMIALARGGYAQEIAVLVRTMVECTTHIEFVLDAMDEQGALRPDVDKYVRDYFADYARSGEFKRAQVRQGAVHKQLGETLDSIAEQNGPIDGRKSAEAVYTNVYLTYSNYVHAKYPEVMDLYGGNPGYFHLDGMLGMPKDNDTIDTFIDTAAISLRLMISKLRLHRILQDDIALRIWFRSS